MDIKIASSEQFEIIHSIMEQAARRIKDKGSTQWAHVLHGAEAGSLKDHLHKHEVYIGIVSDEIVAFCYLTPTASQWDETLWEDVTVESTANVYYLHKLALKQGWTGQRIADKFLIGLQQKISENYSQKVAIRLDCMAEKSMLTQLYERNNFEFVARKEDVQATGFIAPFNIYTWYSS
ncbi:hypothetical protein ACWN8B_06995 [Vagococcus zengguangii]|uniref:GNAT family N-acetyltransferase n=1 Tax=Vagococcus zengguangii TaxID=2571750 RepID=A0A4D7CTH3_9ENTE|nr:hypothetical protein [Vagococcus zengguangii]QCI86162.1 hypothetical protein FA707_03935 [Vagococcus zengguangii]